jgi:hypothetical protein
MTKQSQTRLKTLTQHTLWRGRTSYWRGGMGIVWATVRFIIAVWLWGTALRMAHFPDSSKYIALFLAFATTALFIWASIDLVRSIGGLGLKRCLVLIGIVFAALLGYDALTMTPSDNRISELGDRFSMRAVLIVDGIKQSITGVLRAPEEFNFAYTGVRAAPQLPAGFPTPDPATTPVVIQAIKSNDSQLSSEVSAPPTPVQAAAGTTSDSSIIIGSVVRVVNSGQEPLRARQSAGINATIVARFVEGTVLQVIDGPQVADGYTWWLVRDSEGREGWCADAWLGSS